MLRCVSGGERYSIILFDSNKIIYNLTCRVLPFLGKRYTNKKGVPLKRGTPTKEKQTKQKYENELSFSHYCKCLYQMFYAVF